MPATLPPPPAAQPAPRTDPRQKMSRSATSQSGSQQAPGRPRRSQSEDSSSQDIRNARAANARTKSHNAVPRADKDKPSQHADIIDQMDISGLGGGMFHHDGPFDAVAPSRNRQGKQHRAPVYAFEPGGSGPHNVPVVDKRLSPLAQATIAAMASSDGPYASANLLPTGADSVNDSFGRGTRITPTRKMTLTEAWGKAEPEPFEEFSAGTIGTAGRGSARSSLDEAAGYDAYARRPNARRGESVDLPRRTKLPPPQPINLPGARTGGASLDEPPSSPSYASDYGSSKDGVSRKKSILQRFRKMRENPNVPVLGGGNDAPGGYQSEGPYNPRVGPLREETESYPSSSDPSRNQNYYRGQQPMQGRYQQPVSPAAPGEEPYVVVDGSASRDKALPPPPGAAVPQANNGYFDRVAGADIGRKQSLYKKMKGAVARNGAK
ncbi:hypothetical protein FRC01_005796 [Tulasnella sp. 417]|nr:hypothetical protein FRC01_005796 [Tulasnella sp. 417]